MWPVTGMQIMIASVLIVHASSICSDPVGIQDPVKGQDIWLYSAQDVVQGGRLHSARAWTRLWPTASTSKPTQIQVTQDKEEVSPKQSAPLITKEIHFESSGSMPPLYKLSLKPTQEMEKEPHGMPEVEIKVSSASSKIKVTRLEPSEIKAYLKASKRPRVPKWKLEKSPPTDGAPVTGTVTVQEPSEPKRTESAVEPPYMLATEPTKTMTSAAKSRHLRQKRAAKLKHLERLVRKKPGEIIQKEDVSSNEPIWLQADLNSDHVITGIQTQGKEGTQDWVTSYRVEFSRDCEYFLQLLDLKGQVTIFPGNSDSTSVTTNMLQQPVVARCVRILPTSVHAKKAAMRMELLGCRVGAC